MPKYALFMSKILTAKDVVEISKTVQSLRSELRDTEAVALILRQSKTEQHRFQSKSFKFKVC